jgi:hypothetical protein
MDRMQERLRSKKPSRPVILLRYLRSCVELVTRRRSSVSATQAAWASAQRIPPPEEWADDETLRLLWLTRDLVARRHYSDYPTAESDPLPATASYAAHSLEGKSWEHDLTVIVLRKSMQEREGGEIE